MSDYIYGWSADQGQDLYARAIQRANQALLLNLDQAAAHYLKATLIMLKAKSNDAALDERWSLPRLWRRFAPIPVLLGPTILWP